ncbi:MAG: FimV/HubP family polar landmark protein [Nevskiales bacterium]
MLRMLARLTVVACALWASQAFALGLGDINVKSKLNQPFSATIAVLGASSAQLDSLSVKLGTPDEFNRAGIERSDYLSSLKFTVDEVAGGARVTISSDQIAREPFLNFIVEARSPDGKLLREYTVLLDPPTTADSSAPAAAYTPPPAPVMQVQSAPSQHQMAPAEAAVLSKLPQGPSDLPKHGKGKAPKAAKPAPVEPVAAAAPADTAVAPAPVPEPLPAPAATPASGSAGTYGPIAPQETFWSIATKLRPGPQVSMDQVLLAIYRANPQAFDKGSFNGLLKGHTLQVPSLAEMQDTPAPQAKTAVDAWRHGTHPASVKKNSEPVATAATATPAPAKIEKPKPLRTKPAKPVAEAKPEPAAPAAVAPVAPPPPAPVASKPEPAPISNIPATPPSTPAAPAPEPAPQAATPAQAATTAQTPPVSATAPADTAPAPAEPPKKKVLPPPPPPGLFEDSSTQMELAGVVVLLIGAMGYFIFRRRKDTTPDFRAKAPAPKMPLLSSKPPASAPPKKGAAPVPPPLPPKPQPSKLGDTTALAEDQPAIQAAISGAPLNEPLLAKTSLEDTAQVKMADTLLPVPSFEKTAQAKAAPVGGGDVDFDLTSQFEAQTLSINLDANDPLSEADFHLAYGLYDEAASLLKQALVKEPQRQDLRLKLAETYFAGGKPMEFQETAESLHNQISASDWQKIAIMGRQLCPDSSLFKSDGNAPTPDIDLSLGDSIGPAPAQVLGTTSSRPAASAGNIIDFDLDAELSKAEPATPAPAAHGASESPDFDLSHFDFSSEPPHPAGTEGTVEFNLDELDLSKPAGSSIGHVASGDEIGTKLDLARVYADMGDNEAARGLLGEVLSTGNAAQKGEAEALIKRLSA